MGALASVLGRSAPAIAATPRDTVQQDGTASLYHFRASPDAPAGGIPLLLVPSMINRWYILDLRPGASVAEAMVNAGLDTWLLDWGIPNDEDRYLTWAEILDRLGRAVRAVKRATGAPKVGILGYCMGATLSSIWTALHPKEVAAFANLAGPVNFENAGMLGELVDARWFNPRALTAGGNLPAPQMQSGFVSLRPTAQVGKYVTLADRYFDPVKRAAFKALDTWATDNIPFPASAYVTYIEEMYQQNLLYRGEHRVRGEPVNLGDITCPLLTIAAENDTICPRDAACALNDKVSSAVTDTLIIPGGHVGAVVGSRASRLLYPAISDWLRSHLC
jgi:polyhydroxyalkanoate synthase